MSARPLSFAALLFGLVTAGCPGFGDKDLEDLVEPAPVAPTWDNAVQQILATNCAGCHTEPPVGGAPPGFRFDKYTTADIDDGGLDGAVEKLDRILDRAVMNTTMPPGGGLSLEDRSVLGEWIMAGGPRSGPAEATP